ncbi:MAG: VWA domain-containing protein [Candidatus Lokiarchaeota archaeon]|nr:VWA domain-containing protein [Candidatus Lokiarchaeota archaeon]
MLIGLSDTRDFDIEDTVILIDTSRSLARTDFYPNRFEVLRKAAIAFIESKSKIDAEDRYAIVEFNTDGRIVLEYSENPEDAIMALKNLRIGGISSLGDGMGAALQLIGKKMQEEGDTASGGNVNRLIIFSDGNPSISSIDPIERANVAGELGILLDTVELSRISATQSSSWGGILESMSILGEHFKVSGEQLLELAVKSLSHKKDVYELKKTIPKLELIASDMIDLTNLNPTQKEAVNQKMGLKIDRCEICRLNTCQNHPDNSCIRICPFCKVSIHTDCALGWAKESKLDEAGVMRCPHCLLLLKLPVEVTKFEAKSENIEKSVSISQVTDQKTPESKSSEPMVKTAETAKDGEFFKDVGRIKYKTTLDGESKVIYLAWNNWGRHDYYCNIIAGANEKVVRDFHPIIDFSEGKCYGFRIKDDVGWFSRMLGDRNILDMNVEQLEHWLSITYSDINFIKNLLQQHPEVTFDSDKILDYQLSAEVTFAEPLDSFNRDNLEGNLILGAMTYVSLFRNRPQIATATPPPLKTVESKKLEERAQIIEGIEEISSKELEKMKSISTPEPTQVKPVSGVAAQLAKIDKIPLKDLAMMMNTDERKVVKMLMQLIKSGELNGYLRDGVFYRKQ